MARVCFSKANLIRALRQTDKGNEYIKANLYIQFFSYEEKIKRYAKCETTWTRLTKKNHYA